MAPDIRANVKTPTSLHQITLQPVLHVKMVLVGDAQVGKSSIIEVIKGKTPKKLGDYEATTIDVEGYELQVKEFSPHQVTIFDTGGSEEYDHLRTLTYTDTHVFVICYSVLDWKSFNQVEERWVTEIKYSAFIRKNCPFILVGTKKNLRGDKKAEDSCRAKWRKGPVTTDEGMKLADKIGAKKYLEVDVQDRNSILEIVRHSVLTTLNQRSFDESEAIQKTRRELRSRVTCAQCPLQ